MNKKVEVYKVVQGEIVFDVDDDKDTLWATEEQISQLFGVDRSVINRHIRNIYKSGELNESSTCAKNAQARIEGNRQVTRIVRSYNLDLVISVGYRVNSKKATDFRIWATKVLHRYVVNGVAINNHRIKELDSKKLHELENALGIVKRLVASSELSADEASGVLEVISKYNASFRALKEFDEGYISFARGKKATKNLTPEESMKIISTLKSNVHGDELFGKPRGNAFESSLGAITQTYEKNDLYPSTAEKAANLLYLIIKDHPFYDGNKRIGALLFIVFLTINDYHLTSKGETKISDRALTALALLIAESHPKEKPLLIALICKLLES
ncbi:virulence protein RhuM/Fic/DOC family protein [Candidatus Saccharibacteria bacterium]|nr:virulence protein RhuM/Fic/DOC family protein [Candidatus Saccharibacteria bacterium]